MVPVEYYFLHVSGLNRYEAMQSHLWPGVGPDTYGPHSFELICVIEPNMHKH